MRRFEFLGRMAAALRQRPWLAPTLLVLCLNAGFLAWTQGALANVVWLGAIADEPPEPEVSPHSIHLISPEEAAQLQARLAIEALAAQAAAQAAAQVSAPTEATENEILLEFDPPPKQPKRPVKDIQPIIKLKPRNARG